MTTSPLTRRISTFLLSKGFFLVANKVGDIVKVFDVVLSIPFEALLDSTNQVFNRTALTLLYYLFIK